MYIQAYQGLVEQNQLCLLRQSTRNEQPLLLSTGQGLNLTLGIGCEFYGLKRRTNNIVILRSWLT
jgi:hypothetical protein